MEIQVQVPEGIQAGGQLEVEADGHIITCTVPDGLGPGDTLVVTLPERDLAEISTAQAANSNSLASDAHQSAEWESDGRTGENMSARAQNPVFRAARRDEMEESLSNYYHTKESLCSKYCKEGFNKRDCYKLIVFGMFFSFFISVIMLYALQTGPFAIPQKSNGEHSAFSSECQRNTLLLHSDWRNVSNPAAKGGTDNWVHFDHGHDIFPSPAVSVPRNVTQNHLTTRQYEYWVSLRNAAGQPMAMPTRPVRPNQCGTRTPGWVSGARVSGVPAPDASMADAGRLPEAADGVVSRYVCFVSSRGDCNGRKCYDNRAAVRDALALNAAIASRRLPMPVSRTNSHRSVRGRSALSPPSCASRLRICKLSIAISIATPTCPVTFKLI